VNLPVYQPDAATATRFLFFTGKGGVGKTSLSCATAVRLAAAGRKVLLVSTDPASNLDEVLETSLSNLPSPIPAAPGLDALNINPAAAAWALRVRKSRRETDDGWRRLGVFMARLYQTTPNAGSSFCARPIADTASLLLLPHRMHQFTEALAGFKDGFRAGEFVRLGEPECLCFE
jgi:hypothetical protein